MMRFELPSLLVELIKVGSDLMLLLERGQCYFLIKEPIFPDADPIGCSLASSLAQINEWCRTCQPQRKASVS